MAEDVRPFEELAVGDEPVELGIVDEMIVLAVDLAGPLRAGGGGDRKADAVVAFQDHAGDGRFPGSARARQDEEKPAPLERIDVRHGRYWRGRWGGVKKGRFLLPRPSFAMLTATQ